MKKRILMLIGLLIAIFIISGCTLSKEEQQKKKEVSNTAKQLCSEYLKEKYDIQNAKVSKVIVHTAYDAVLPTNYFTCSATVYYKYKDKTIEVDVDTRRNVISDNYQFDKIRQDFLKYTKEYFHNNIIISNESFLISGRNKGKFFMFEKDEFYDGNIENFKQYLSCISFQGFIKNDYLNEANLLDNTNNNIDNFIEKLNNKNVMLNINIGIYKGNVNMSKAGKTSFNKNFINNSIYESLNYSYDSRSNPVNLDKTLIKRTDDRLNIITEEFDYRNFVRISDDLEMPEYKYNGEVVDVKKLIFENKDIDQHFTNPYFDKRDEERYKIVYDFFNYGGTLASFKYTSFIWFRYDSKNANKLIVLDESIKPIDTFKGDNSIYFRVVKHKKYAIAIMR